MTTFLTPSQIASISIVDGKRIIVFKIPADQRRAAFKARIRSGRRASGSPSIQVYLESAGINEEEFWEQAALGEVMIRATEVPEFRAQETIAA